MHSSRMLTARSLPYGGVSITENAPRTETPQTETPLDRDPLPGPRPPWTETSSQDRDTNSGQRPLWDRDPPPRTETPSWTETPPGTETEIPPITRITDTCKTEPCPNFVVGGNKFTFSLKNTRKLKILQSIT